MTNEELRQLDAEADAYQADADAMSKPRYSQNQMDVRTTEAYARGYADCLDRFNKPPGEPAHLPEDYSTIDTGNGAPFYITREHESADPSVGIQAWECFIVYPNPKMSEIIRAHAELVEACTAALRERFGWDDPCCDSDPITNKLRLALRKAGH